MKNYSFYQFVMTVRNQRDDKGRLVGEIFDDLAFLKRDDDLDILSDYIETRGDFTLPMSVLDNLYEEYTERLKF